MFGGKFSLSKFSLPYLGKIRHRMVVLVESAQGGIGVGKKSLRKALFSETVSGRCMSVRKIPRSISIAEKISAAIVIQRSFCRRVQTEERTNVLVHSNIELHKKAYMEEVGQAGVLLSRQSKRNFNLVEVSKGNIDVGRTIIKKLTAFEAVQGFFCVISYKTAAATLEIVLNPGEELRLDSDAFTAMLGQENVLHLHSGDWFFASRTLLDITIRTGNAQAVDGTIIFVERFL